MSETTYHIPVLLHTVIEYLNINPEGIYVDGTLGGGGHSEAILTNLTTGSLLGFDVDDEALETAAKRLVKFGNRFIAVKSNFEKMPEMLYRYDIQFVDGILLDLGVSSRQLDRVGKGFTFRENAPLDLRLNKDLPLTAADVVNTYSVQELTDIFRQYGEEKFSFQIATEIVRSRNGSKILTTHDLCRVIDIIIFEHQRKKSYSRIFQALRIEVNQELKVLEEALNKSLDILKRGGRIVVISYHSLEDRIVKEFFKYHSLSCVCPPKQPICTCKKEKFLEIITRRAVEPNNEEIIKNPRSRSAKLRVAERI